MSHTNPNSKIGIKDVIRIDSNIYEVVDIKEYENKERIYILEDSNTHTQKEFKFTELLGKVWIPKSKR